MKRILLITALLFAANAHAQTATDHVGHHPDSAQSQSALVDGEVRRVDRGAKKITLRHGAIPNLDMPPMTMVFQVKDQAMLDKVKAGDKVRFSAEKSGSTYTVNRIESAK